MKKINLHTKISLLTLAILSASSAYAQEEQRDLSDDESTLDPIEQIEIIGSRLRTSAPSEPVKIFTSEDIELRGISNIDQLLRQVTGNNASISSANAGSINGDAVNNRGTEFANRSGGSSINLRGLGAGSTLVLINGRRTAGEGSANNDFVDISGIPVEAIERVEILTAGASAIYGADAVAGVVNIILKKDYDESRVSIRHEVSSSGGDETRLSATIGKSWTSGNLTVSASYQDTKAVRADKFGINTLDFRAIGGEDRRNFNSTLGVFQVDDSNIPDLLPGDEFIDNLLLLPADSAGIDDFTDPSVFTRVNRSDIGTDIKEILPISLTPEEEKYSISARLRQDISSKYVNEFFVDVLYSSRDTETLVEAPNFFLNSFDLAESPFGIPFFDDDSFSGFREDINFSADLTPVVEAGIIPHESFKTESETFSISTGLKGDFTKHWDWEVNTTYSLNEDQEFARELDTFEVFNGLLDFDTFEFIRDPFNLVRGDFLTNFEAQTALQQSVFTNFLDGKTTLKMVQGIGRGQFFSDRDAGALDISYGGEYREETVEFAEKSLSFFGDATTIPNLDAIRSTTAIYGEASLPVTTSFTINGALRYESIDNEGTTVTSETSLNAFKETGLDQFVALDELSAFKQTDDDLTWRLGVAWNVTADFLFRATTGTSFRAPNAFEIGEPSITFFLDDDGLIDPQNGGEVPFDKGLLSGGNNTLKSEEAETLNVGFIYSPDFNEHYFTFDADYYEINYNNRITSSAPFVGDSFNDVLLQEEAIQRDANGDIDFIFIRPINLAKDELSGIDVGITHSTEMGAAVIENRFNVSHVLNRESQIIDGGEITDQTGINQPNTRWNFSSVLSYKDFSLTGVIHHTGHYESRRGAKVESFTTVDLNLVYHHSSTSKYSDNLTLSLGVTNLLNEDPSFVDNGNGFSSLSYDVRRRVVQFEARKQF